MLIRCKFLIPAFALICLPITASAQGAETGLETLIQCKPGTTFTVPSIESQFRELGLKKEADGFYFPEKGKKVAFLGDEIIAALISTAYNEKKIAIFLKNQTGKQLAKKFRATTINEYADTDEPSYVKETSAKTTLLIGSAAEVHTGSKSVSYHSSIACQVIL